MDFKKFYFSPEGRINRQQFWLWLVLPLTAIELLLALVDVKTGNYNPELSVGLFSGIFALVALGAHRPYPNHRIDLAAGRTRLSHRHVGAEPVRSAGERLVGLRDIGAGPSQRRRRASSGGSFSLYASTASVRSKRRAGSPVKRAEGFRLATGPAMSPRR